jgi:RimJ/RimL family protein N-acetyltransferase
VEALDISGARVRAVPATRERAAELQACLDGAPGYFEQLEGAPASPDAARQLLADAEADPERQVLLLEPRAGGPPLGVLDLYLHHPEPGVAHVGLLLLREAVQGQGLGREVVEELSRALAAAGFTALRASVADETPGARAFWERIGAAPVGRLDRGVTVYEVRLEPPASARRRR